MLTTRIDQVTNVVHAGIIAHHPTTVSILAAFVVINTVIYVGLALVRMLPRIRMGARFRHGYVRSETRSIHPAMEWPEPDSNSGR